jgi:hypothetical protein
MSRVRIVLHLPDDPCFLNAAPSQFDTALVIRVLNARDAMGGEGAVRSEVGCGTTCALYLPRFEGADRATDEGEPELPMDGHGTCVLMVEGEIDVGAFAVQILADLGSGTVWAADAEEPLAQPATNADRFAVVLPGRNGIDGSALIDSEHFVRWISLIKSRESFRDTGPLNL